MQSRLLRGWTVEGGGKRGRGGGDRGGGESIL